MTTDGLTEPAASWFAAGRHLPIAGRKVFVRQWGRGVGLLFIHGFPTSSYDWRQVAEQLKSRFRVTAVDLLGFGLSDKPAACGYSLFEQADLLEATMARLRQATVHVVSHDLGTSVHCELLARQAEGRLGFGIRSSLLLNGSMLQWMARITPLQELLSANATLPQAMELCAASGLDLYLPALRAIMHRPEAVGADDARAMRELLAYQDGHLRLPALSLYMRERYLHADRWLEALAAASPVRLLWADRDPIAHAEMGRELARRCPRASYRELTELGHFPMLEDPTSVSREIAGWLDEQPLLGEAAGA